VTDADVARRLADFTPGERRILELVAEDHDWKWVLACADRLLDEARSVEGPDLEHLANASRTPPRTTTML